MSERTVSVFLRAQVDGYISGFKRAEAATKSVKDKVDETARSHQNLLRAAELVGTVGAIAIGKKLVTAASDLNETVSKTQIVFGKSSDAVLAWSKTSATAMGMSQQQAAEAASSFGNLFVAMKLGGKQSSDMSMKLVQLAGDLASFNNTNPADALEALRSGLVGEVEPLRRYGVNLNDATLQQKALSMGLITHTTGVLPPAIKAQAAYALILEQTKTAQGDFARTSTGLANSQRIFTAEVANAQAALGNALLPTVNTGVHALNSLLGVFNALPQPIQSAVVITGALGGALLLLAPKIVATKNALTELGVAGGGSMKTLSIKTAAVTTAFIAATVAAKAFSETTIAGGKSAEAMARSLTDLANGGTASFGWQIKGVLGDSKSFNDALAQLVDNHWWDQIGTGISGAFGQELSTTLGASKASVDAVDQALAAMVASGNAKVAARAFQVLADSFKASGGDVSQLTNLFPKYEDAIKPATASTTGYGNAAAGAAHKTYDLNAAIDKLRGKAMDADQATANLEQAIDDAAQAAIDNGKALKEHNGQLDLTTPKARAARDALANIASTALDGVAAWRASGMGARDVGQKTLEARDAFIKTARQMGLNKTDAEKLASAYGLIPRKVVSDIIANTKPAKAALTALQQQYADLVRFINSHPIETAAHYGLPAPKKKTDPAATRAGGGPIVGPGTKTSDDVPLWGSNGEWMMQASAVDKYGPGVMAAINAGTWVPAAPMATSSGGAAGVVIQSGAVVVHADGADAAAVRATVDEAFSELVRELRAQ